MEDNKTELDSGLGTSFVLAHVHSPNTSAEEYRGVFRHKSEMLIQFTQEMETMAYRRSSPRTVRCSSLLALYSPEYPSHRFPDRLVLVSARRP